MAEVCGIGRGKRVLDVGCGKGVTACYLAQKYDCEVIGIDGSERTVEYAKRLARSKGLEGRIDFRVANAHRLLSENESFDIVIAECTTVLLDKERAFREFIRVLKPGGYIGDLEMIWRVPPPEELVRHTCGVWGGFKTMTLRERMGLFERLALVDIRAVDFSDEIPDIGKALLKELGFKGVIKMVCRLLLCPDICRTMIEYARIFREYKELHRIRPYSREKTAQ